jgi:hypothetical protein
LTEVNPAPAGEAKTLCQIARKKAATNRFRDLRAEARIMSPGKWCRSGGADVIAGGAGSIKLSPRRAA